ncbi:transmembrane protein [Perilla frutescens var. frutescens]|nr:transmembrane protein [Perilla frutescens var. frutescens]
MAAQLSALTFKPLPLSTTITNKPFSPPHNTTTHGFRVSANLGGGTGGDGEIKKGGKKKFITKEQEPEQYWQTAGEREGENPMKTPLPYIIIFGMSTPFVILAIAFANGWIKGSRTWLALLVPIFVVFARLSSGHGAAVLIPITFIFLSTVFLLTFSKRKPIMPMNSLLKETHVAEKHHQPTLQQNTSISSADCSCDDSVKVPSGRDTREAGNGEEVLMGSQDLYSESESMDQCSSTSSEDQSSDLEWPYNMVGQRLDCSDGSISDEESLIEIAIPSGQFVSEKDPKWKVKCCKSMFQKDLWAEIYEMNEEDNLIEIDINIGSIKC